ncbi:MAG: cupin domain-containing protein [Pyrinomonadaceae bacterium]
MPAGKFIRASEIKREHMDWGELGWLSRPAMTNAKNLVVIEVTLKPGAGHDFHQHPAQEEAIYVIAGEIEQWLENKKQVLRPGDCVFIPPGVVHASFNTGDQPATLLVTLGPVVGEAGYEVVEVGTKAPWNSLRPGS